MNRTATPGLQRRATHRLFAAYLLVSASALLFPHRPSSWPVLLLLHVAGALLALRPQLLQSVAALVPRAGEVLADWYPLLLIPALYAELAVLNVAIWNGRYFDPIVQQVETSLFGSQPSRDFASHFPMLWLSETLHAAYLSYYFLIYGPPVILYLLGRRADFRRVVFAVMLTFFVHYVFFIFFPVQGPRYLFARPTGTIARGKIYQLAHRILELGSARGAAFPSSHVGVAAAQSCFTVFLLPRVAPLFIALTIGLAFGAVYGGFHYGTDVCAGLLLGLCSAAVASPLQRRMGGPRV